MSSEQAFTWLGTTLEKTQNLSQDKNTFLGLPMKLNKNSKLENYKIQDLHDDQKDITAVVMYKLQEWFTCVQNENTTNYTSLRLTICGEAGSGKTVLINTLVSLIRQLTQKKIQFMSVVLLAQLLSMLVD